ncbi:hypothetical protein ACHAXS_006806 [Conticribra weissflogii]
MFYKFYDSMVFFFHLVNFVDKKWSRLAALLWGVKKCLMVIGVSIIIYILYFYE